MATAAAAQYRIDQWTADDGLAATKQITAAYPKAQIMIVTHHTDIKLPWAAHDAGAKQYVLKENLLSILEILGD